MKRLLWVSQLVFYAGAAAGPLALLVERRVLTMPRHGVATVFGKRQAGSRVGQEIAFAGDRNN